MSVRITKHQLVEETQLLEELTGLLKQARAIRPDRPPLAEIIEAQAAMCERLAERRAERAQVLTKAGYGPRDLLVALLAGHAKPEHAELVSVFGAFVAAAEQAQVQIDINREFFSVALAAVEDALGAAAPESESPTYDLSGGKRRPGGSVIVSTVT